LLGRGRAGVREIAVRLAIGASRGRLVRQLTVESLLIALGGGVLELFIALFGVEMLSNVRWASWTSGGQSLVLTRQARVPAPRITSSF
jgi:ABC-type antimicrobial peptide transport system permease subunit